MAYDLKKDFKEPLKKAVEKRAKEPPPACPECDKLTGVHNESQAIGAFLDWLFHEQGVTLCQQNKIDIFVEARILSKEEKAAETLAEKDLVHRRPNDINSILAVYFGIDERKCEEERRALLDWLAKQHDKKRATA